METYQTQNLAIAATLATLGVPFAQLPDGRVKPVINFYDVDIIRAMLDDEQKPIYSGWDLEKAAEHAWKNGREGKVAFCFQRTDTLEAILKAYNEQADAILEAEEGNAKQSIGVPTTEIEIAPETAGRLACQLLRNRKRLKDAWNKPVPLVAIHGESRSRKTAKGTEITGSFKVLSLGLSDEKRERLGL